MHQRRRGGDLESQHFSKGLIDVVTRALYVSIYSGEIMR